MNEKKKRSHNIIESLLPLAVTIDKIKLDPRNARLHPEPNMTAIQRSLKAYGQRKPIVVNARTGAIEAGNGLFQAAVKLGWTYIAAVMVTDDDATAKGYAIMDNKSALLAEWDFPVLKDLLLELDTGAFDMDLTGFNQGEIEDLMTKYHVPGTGLTDEDQVPEEVEPICMTGDLWQLGNHRLLCGDATRAEDVARLMDGKKADMVFTDPPYGIDLDTDYSSMVGNFEYISKKHMKRTGKKYEPIVGDSMDFDPTLLLSAFGYCEEIFLWGGDYYLKRLPAGGSLFVWDKRQTEVFDKMYGSVFEICWSKSRHRREIIRHTWAGIFGTQMEDIKKRLHPTQKPVGVCEWVIAKFSQLQDRIVDLYGGSGSTLIACEKLDRRCFMLEIVPRYCDVIIRRWEDFTGRKGVKL